MAVYASHNYWRIRFLEGAGSFYALRNLQFRRFSTADPVNSCGTVDDCRTGVESSLDYNEQLEGTRATDLFLYGGAGAFDTGWSSLEYPGGLPDTVYIARHYPTGRDVAYIGLIATSGAANDTTISRFAIDYSDDGETWIESREFTTNPVWADGEERVFALPNSDSFLPVFSFRPNWKEPIPERLSFLTDVMRGPTGAEQRRSLRPTPRRTLEVDFLLRGRERTFWDLFHNRLAGGEIMVPLYWEITTTSAALVEDVTDRINFSTVSREWFSVEHGLAILMGDTALDYEVVQIVDVDNTGIDLAFPVQRAWPKGTKLLPLRRAVIEDAGEPSHATAGIATATVQFRFVVENPWTPLADSSPVYEGLPVFLDEPNWVQNLSVDYGHEIAKLDTNIGLPFQIDTLGRAVIGQSHRWFLTGRERLARFRDLIYRHRGRAGSFWLPTFKADLTLADDIDSAETQMTVENVGMSYVGGPTSGREHIAIKHDGGTILRKIISAIPGATPATEILELDSPLGLALSRGQVRRISFADTARFDTDDFEIIHFGGIDAHHEASAMFRSFKNSRTSPTPIYDPIPLGVKTSGRCGSWTSRAICFVLDRSGSMATAASGGGTRMTVLQEAMEAVLDALAPYTSGYVMDLAAVSFSTGSTSITRRNADVAGINAIKSWINGLATGGGTDFDAGMAGAETFFDNTSASLVDRYLFFITDGLPDPPGSEIPARARLLAMTPVPFSHGISIDLSDTTYLAQIDNTPDGGIPVVSSGNYATLVNAVLGAF